MKQRTEPPSSHTKPDDQTPRPAGPDSAPAVDGKALDAADLAAQLEVERAARQAAEAARDEAQVENQYKSEFVALLSREIRTPLNGVLGMIELLQTTRLDAEQREFVATLSLSAQSLVGVVNDVIHFTTVDGAGQDLEVNPFSAARLAEEAVSLMRPMAEQKGLRMLLWVGRMPKRVTGNPTRMQQILVHLLSDAIKLTERGEVRLDLSASALEAGRWRLTWTVSDTGIGIDSSNLQNLRAAIQKTPNSEPPGTNALGLALPIAARLVHQLAGSLSVESEPGVGSRIAFSIVLDEPADRVASRPEISTRPVVLDQLRVLVAEDNPVSQTLALAVLGRFGIQAVLARDGQEAVSIASQQPFDIVLMDVRMPKLDGLEATQAIRALPAHHPQPWIIAVTANAFDQDRQQCLNAGMNDFLAKPFNQTSLRDALMNARLPA